MRVCVHLLDRLVSSGFIVVAATFCVLGAVVVVLVFLGFFPCVLCCCCSSSSFSSSSFSSSYPSPYPSPSSSCFCRCRCRSCMFLYVLLLGCLFWFRSRRQRPRVSRGRRTPILRAGVRRFRIWRLTKAMSTFKGVGFVWRGFYSRQLPQRLGIVGRVVHFEHG